jgi:hypothetical protein
MLPDPGCDLTDFFCRSEYFAEMAPAGSSQTLSGGFDGYVDRVFINELVVNSLKVGKVTLTDNSGSGVIPAGQTEAKISAVGVKDNSIIQITFESDYAPATRYFVKDKTPGTGFTVVVDQPVAHDAKFTWWLVGREEASQSGIISPIPTPTITENPTNTPVPEQWISITPTPALFLTPTSGLIKLTPTPEITTMVTPEPTPVPAPARSGFGTLIAPSPIPTPAEAIDLTKPLQNNSGPGVISPVGNGP